MRPGCIRNVPASQPAANQIIFLIVSFRDMSRNTENADEKNSLIFITLTLSLSWGGRRWLSMKAVNLSPEHLSCPPPPMPLSLQWGSGGLRTFRSAYTALPYRAAPLIVFCLKRFSAKRKNRVATSLSPLARSQGTSSPWEEDVREEWMESRSPAFIPPPPLLSKVGCVRRRWWVGGCCGDGRRAEMELPDLLAAHVPPCSLHTAINSLSSGYRPSSCQRDCQPLCVCDPP